jgi:hypothetical protein
MFVVAVVVAVAAVVFAVLLMCLLTGSTGRSPASADDHGGSQCAAPQATSSRWPANRIGGPDDAATELGPRPALSDWIEAVRLLESNHQEWVRDPAL